MAMNEGIDDAIEAGPTAAEILIRAEIAARGSIPFARFMEQALYAPGAGYYQAPGRAIGRSGDFYTSVSVGPVFGFLLAQRLVHWLETPGAGWACADHGIDVVEAAAHDGRLAGDILTALRDFAPDVLERVRYRILEPFEARRRVQEAALQPWGERVTWAPGWSGLARPVRGVVVANELLDAFPVHRFHWDRGAARWWESGVEVDADGRLAWCRLPVGTSGVPGPNWPGPLLEVLPEGFVAESSPGAVGWWREAASALETGWLVTADYGFGEGDTIRPERTGGTLRAYHRHRLVDDLLARPGEQDLTAHVEFPAILEAGERAGLETEAFREQGRWLGETAVAVLARGGASAEWLTARAGQLRTLTHPVHLGRAMRVLVQRRNG
jgi:SAM-dependent MidA family methyltransferase